TFCRLSTNSRPISPAEEVQMRSPLLSAVIALAGVSVASAASPKQAQKFSFKSPTPIYTKAVAVDLSKPVRNLPPMSRLAARTAANGGLGLKEVRPERELGDIDDHGFAGDGAVQRSFGPRFHGATTAGAAGIAAATISAPLLTFEGVSNQD